MPAFAVLLAVLFFSPVTSKAETKTGKCGDNVSYTFDTESENLIISGSGPMYDYNKTPWFDYVHDIKTVTIQSGVTRIGDRAFSYGYYITSITIPSSVTSIGQRAFWSCGRLESIKLPDSITVIEDKTFEDCNSLKSVNIPDSVTSIGNEAFNQCKSLEYIKIPDNVTTIKEYAFNECDNLIVAEIPKSVKTIEYHAFGYTVVEIFDSEGSPHEVTESVPGFMIVTESGSAAETYANKNGFVCGHKIGDKIAINVPESQNFTYNGYVKTGVPENDKFYTITGNTAKDAGSYTAKLSIKSGFVWSDGSAEDKVIQWEIKPASIDSANVKILDQTFSPLSIEPNPVVTIGEITLIKDKDYEVFYVGNSGIGTATAAIVGKGNYEGTVSTKFTINPVSIESARVTVPDQNYTGKALRPELKVEFDSCTLEEGKDYTVSYSDNVNIGTANVLIEGKGNYTGSISASFSIVAPKYSVVVTSDGNGSALTDPVSAKEGTEIKLSATPKDGYKFKEWQVIKGGVTIADNKFKIGSEDVEIKAIFEEISKAPEQTATPIPTVTAAPTATSAPTAAPTATAAVTGENTVTPTVVPGKTDPAEAKDGDVIEDKASKASYQITSEGTVTYVSVQNNVTTVNIPAEVKIAGKKYKVTEIKANAFKNNKKLKKITIGKNIKKIGKNAFYGCKNLKKIIVKTTKLTTKSVGKNAFKGINAKAVVKVPKKKLKVYKPILEKAGIKGKKQTITK